MYRIFYLTAIYFTCFTAAGQAGDRYFAFTGGPGLSSNRGSFSGNNSGYDCYVGTPYLRDVNQTGTVAYEAYFLMFGKQKAEAIRPVLGLGWNEKGYNESGTRQNWDEYESFFYTQKVIYNYAGLLAGFSYKMLGGKKWACELLGLANPELFIKSNEVYVLNRYSVNRFALSAKFCLSVEYKIGNDFSLFLMPDYQFSVTDYNRKMFFLENSYRPAKAGLSVGIKFR